MNLSELNNDFLPIHFEKLSYRNKTTVLLRDFNANLLNYDIDTGACSLRRQVFEGFVTFYTCVTILSKIEQWAPCWIS